MMEVDDNALSTKKGASSSRRVVKSRRQPKRQRLSRHTSSDSASHRSEIHLQLPIAFPRGNIIHVSAPTLWDYLLYARGLMPMPIHQLLEFGNNNSCMKGSAKRKISQAKKNLQQLKDDWNLLRNLCPKMGMVLLSLGPSWSRTKEAYLIDSTNLSNSADTNPTISQQSAVKKFGGSSSQMSIKNQNILSRRLLRELVQVEAENCACHRLCGSYQLHVSFRVSSVVASELFEEKNDRWSSRLILRHGFDINTTQAKTYRQGLIFLERNDAAYLTNTVDTLHGNSERDDGIWISLRSTIKGVRL